MDILEQFAKIRTFVFDVDGVLASDNILVLENSEMARSMNTKDGYALQLAIKKGYRIVVITGGVSKAVQHRLNGLGVEDVFLGIHDKQPVLEQYVREHQLQWEEMLYMGDDVPDKAPMRLVGMACCPKDAVPAVKAVSHYISPYSGGKGCGRDVLEKVLTLRGDWE